MGVKVALHRRGHRRASCLIQRRQRQRVGRPLVEHRQEVRSRVHLRAFENIARVPHIQSGSPQLRQRLENSTVHLLVLRRILHVPPQHFFFQCTPLGSMLRI